MLELQKELAGGIIGTSSPTFMRWTDKFRKRITSVEEIAPLAFDHQGNMDNWLITEKIEDVVIGTSIPYNYEQSKF